MLGAVRPKYSGSSGGGGTPGTGVFPYLHTQSAMSSAWIINHDLGRKPSITVRDSGGIERWGDVTHSGDAVAVVTFSIAISGEAYCI